MIETRIKKTSRGNIELYHPERKYNNGIWMGIPIYPQ